MNEQPGRLTPAPAGGNRVSLDDRYDLGARRIFLSGTQALVRLALVQHHRDRLAGLNTAGFISGYRGSPLGGLDQELWHAARHLAAHDIRFVPGVNEELGATAVWGTQMVGLNPRRRVDGVFGMWYGKGPGLDRAMDAVKHGNAAGTGPHGGVLAIAGDDHGAKSSTLAHQSDHNFAAAFVPFLSPASIDEFVEYGLLGIAMSRFAGTWVGFKATGDTVETSATIDTAREQRAIILPDFDFPEGGVHIRRHDIWREEDTRLQRYKGFAAQAFARANGIDTLVWDTPRPRFGIMATGKAYADTREALARLGIDARVAADIGLRLYKVGMPWPLEPDGARAFAEGLEEVLVIEEKREFIEHQLKWQLYNWKEGVRPTVIGKQDEQGAWLLTPDNELTPAMVARAIALRLARFHRSDRIDEALRRLAAMDERMKGFTPAVARKPYFCSGCPHNTSTRIPEGSRALAGIGCHVMALWMDRADSLTHMGGEGITWVGEAPFVDETHIFANMGDGTYFHSGILAIRQAVAAGATMTYKILYNDAVAMTGGQPVDGQLTVPQVAAQLLAEGVARVWVLSEDVARYPAGTLPAGVEALDRDSLDAVSRQARETTGTTVIVYDQTCAAEKRRRRKRGRMADPDTRVVINPAVCEGCGDCSVQSNCVSVEPLATEFGRKRRINQSSCNKDYSCLHGFCPSFVTVEGGRLRRASVEFDLAGVPEPEIVPPSGPVNILVTGVGGTGVLTISALLGMAAHVAGLASTTADMAGLAQKGGAVWSHVRLAPSDGDLLSPRIMGGSADVVLACDAVVAAERAAQALMSAERTRVVANADLVPLADFVRNRDFDFREALVRRTIAAAAKDSDFITAERHATALLGDAIGANMLLLGFAWQKGLIPLSAAALDEAIVLNDVAVAFNRRAFALGRLLAHDPARVEAMSAPPAPPAATLPEMVERRAADIVAWGDAAAADRYRACVSRVAAAEEAVTPGSSALAMTVARALHKLIAYKDEYEVARLMTDGRFTEQLGQTFSERRRLHFHLSPPLLAGIDRRTGRPRKYRVPGWLGLPLFGMLAAMKRLRGTALDPFGKSGERRRERAAAVAYEVEIDRLVADLTPGRHALAVEIAALPLDVRGYGPVKAEAERAVAARRAECWARWDGIMVDREPAAAGRPVL